MAALLVGMAIMAIVMSVAMPTWSHMIRREKEEELIFRGNQYARAINFYQRKYANASPPSLDVLVEQRFLRKKFKDPLSPNEDGEFGLLYVNAGQMAGQVGAGSAGQVGAGTVLGSKPTGPIMGVASKNTGESIRTFNGKKHYNEWQFIGLQQSTQAGPGAQLPGRGRFGPGMMQPQRGQPQPRGGQQPLQPPGGQPQPPRSGGFPQIQGR
jgi:type II secretory pathway pseudopilin PulG